MLNSSKNNSIAVLVRTSQQIIYRVIIKYRFTQNVIVREHVFVEHPVRYRRITYVFRFMLHNLVTLYMQYYTSQYTSSNAVDRSLSSIISLRVIFDTGCLCRQVDTFAGDGVHSPQINVVFRQSSEYFLIIVATHYTIWCTKQKNPIRVVTYTRSKQILILSKCPEVIFYMYHYFSPLYD